MKKFIMIMGCISLFFIFCFVAILVYCCTNSNSNECETKQKMTFNNSSSFAEIEIEEFETSRFMGTHVNASIKYEIISMANESELQGSFILGCGGISQEEYYVFMIKTKDGIVRTKTPIKNCFLEEIDSTKIPYFGISIEGWARTGLLEGGNLEDGFRKYYLGYESARWEWDTDLPRKLFVPIGTIIRRFEISNGYNNSTNCNNINNDFLESNNCSSMQCN